MKPIDAEELIRWIKERCEIVKEENILISSNVIIDRINTLISVNELKQPDVSGNEALRVALPCGVCGGTGKASIDYGTDNEIKKYYEDDNGTGQ